MNITYNKVSHFHKVAFPQVIFEIFDIPSPNMRMFRALKILRYSYRTYYKLELLMNLQHLVEVIIGNTCMYCTRISARSSLFILLRMLLTVITWKGMSFYKLGRIAITYTKVNSYILILTDLYWCSFPILKYGTKMCYLSEKLFYRKFLLGLIYNLHKDTPTP